MRIATGFLLAALAGLGVGSPALAATDFPTKPMRLIVPFPAGGTMDNVARLLAQSLNDALGQPVIVENRPGGGTTIGTHYLARAAADGYTFGMVANSFAINPALLDNLQYDTRADFVPIALAAYTPHVLAARADMPASNLQEVLDAARAEPGQLTFASFGTGTSPHIAIEMLKVMGEVDVVHIPYKGQAPALNDLLGGHVDFLFSNAPDALPHIESGRVQPIAVADTERLKLAPNIPTFAESGMPGFESNSWFGVIAPAGVPEEIVERLSSALVAIVAQDDVREQLSAQGLEPAGMPSAEFSAYLDAEIEKAASLVSTSGASTD